MSSKAPTRTDPLIWKDAARLVALAGCQFSTGVTWHQDRSFLYTIHVRHTLFSRIVAWGCALPFAPRQVHVEHFVERSGRGRPTHGRLYLTVDVTLDQVKDFLTLVDAAIVAEHIETQR
jgi:hypothetical protein